MMKVWTSLMLASFAWSTSAGAVDTCPPRETGVYPWVANEVMKGDLWAWIYLELDENDRPERCLMGENNIRDPDLRFFACQAFTDDWKPGQPVQTSETGKRVVKRFFIMHGPEHEKATKQARKKFFAENPDERPECYPE